MYLLSPLFTDAIPSADQLRALKNVVLDPRGVSISTLDIPEFMHRALTGTQEDYDLYAELLNRCATLDFTVSDSSFFMAVQYGLDVHPNDVRWMSAVQAANRGLTFLCANPSNFREFTSLRCLSTTEFQFLRASGLTANEDLLREAQP